MNSSVALAVELSNDGAKTSVLKELKRFVGTFTELYISKVSTAHARNVQ